MLSRIAGLLAVFVFSAAAVAQDHSMSGPETVLSEGYAGIYPEVLRGRVTTSGAVFDPERFVASHRYLPIGSLVLVVRDDTGESVSVRILDRGPYGGDRIMDLSAAAARALRMHGGDEKFVRIVRPVDPDVVEAPADRGWSRLEAEGGYTIQLGSFSNEAAAETARGGAEGAWIQRVAVDGQIFYRLNFGRYRSRDDAAEDLDRLETRGFFGFVKSVAEGV